MPDQFVSILMLVHNAPEYTNITVRSLRRLTAGVRYELVVIDNASNDETRALVTRLRDEGLIDRLELLGRNSLFAEGNNIAAGLASPDATHLLLLNSDVEIKSADWLKRMLARHRRGATAYGIALDPIRVDGYCMLIDADLYRAHPLDESHQWWWAVTKQQAALLTEGLTVQGWAAHEKYLHHFGGRSGSAFSGAQGMDVSREEVERWFGGKRAEVIDLTWTGRVPGHGATGPVARARARVRRLRRRLTSPQ